jgi:CheY-like chemotaxis protein
MDKKHIILLIDDEPQILKLYGDILKEEGFEVMMASSGPEGLKLIQEKRPDLILLDVKMPEMDGIDVFDKIKNNPDTKDIKIVFLSAFGDPNIIDLDINAAKEIGAIDFIRKGISLNELVTKIKQYIS